MHGNSLLDAIRKYQFYAVELNLFLDNFPHDEKATRDYELVSHRLNCLINKYEHEYGPLTNFGSSFKNNPEKWVNQPWPWESYK
ncbi:spore coat protein CotJB [Clostridium cylindrosporum]|uniref:CotJB protein n=1 Tax=Clostridium cylindrosporum DSM 605 TaxID=1121307 RepID=A0A0J8DGB8_CLOCY|nr:spore coat protein CotJB [Clostridium cylindrosporum]KMT23213.1 CotJB protein [Clostridium cylindrosporum DSM 605]